MNVSAAQPRPLMAHIWPREVREWYVEPEWCSQRLFAEEKFEGGVYDPACGLGRIVEAALQAGLNGYGSDLVARGWDSTRTPHDFLSSPTDERHDYICTNVPFSIVRPFAEHALKLARSKVAMFLPLARLNAAHWLQDTPLSCVWLLTPRPSVPPGQVILDGKKPSGDKRDFCWLIWAKGHVGTPAVRWLHRERGGFTKKTARPRRTSAGMHHDPDQ